MLLTSTTTIAMVRAGKKIATKQTNKKKPAKITSAQLAFKTAVQTERAQIKKGTVTVTPLQKNASLCTHNLNLFSRQVKMIIVGTIVF